MTPTAQPALPDIERRLAEHAIGVQYSQLPAHTINRTATFIADTLSVGMAGSAVPEAKQLLDTLVNEHNHPTTTVWGADRQLSAPQAIMANAFNVHCQEFDCVHEGAVVHAMATLLPVLMAEVEQRHHRQQPVSGQSLVAAVVAGIEVACTLGLAAEQAMRFFRPATAGGFGAVAGLARLRQWDAATLVSAWGFQLAQTSGTMQGHREGSPVLPLQVSFNARAAWQSGELAQSALNSLNAPISGQCGYLAMFEDAYDIQILIETLGRVWRIDEFSHKPYPSGRATHAGIEGLLNLLETHSLVSQDIASVVVTGPSLINRLVNRPALAGPAPNYARLCMPYVLAKIMQHQQLVPNHYLDHARSDPQTYALAQKVRMVVDQNPDPNAFTPVNICVTMADGTKHETTIDHMLASPQRPLTAAQCKEKFLRCCALAVKAPDSPDQWFDALMAIDLASDVAHLIPHHAD